VASNDAIGQGISKVGSKEIEPFDVSPGLELLMHLGLTEGFKKDIGEATGADSLMIRVNKDGDEFSFEAEAKACPGDDGWRLFPEAPFAIKSVSFYARREVSSRGVSSVGFGFGADIETDEGPTFYGSIGLSSSPTGWNMEAAVEYTGEGYWNQPFGIEALKVSAFTIAFEVSISPPSVRRFEITGAGCLGQAEGDQFCADISIFADVTEPVFFFSGRFDRLNLKQIAEVFDPNGNIPAQANNVLETFGFEELDLEFAAAPGPEPVTLQRWDGTEVVVEGGYVQATVAGLQAGIIRADYASFFFEMTTDVPPKVSVETAISLPRTQVRISQLDWLNSDGGFTVTFLEPESSELSDVVAEFFGGADATIPRDGPFFYLKASSTEAPVIAFGAAVELYILDTKVEASVTGSFDQGDLTASFSARLPEVRIPDWMIPDIPDTFDGYLEWIDSDNNVFDNSGHFVKNALTGGTNMVLDGVEQTREKTEETIEWIAWHLGRRRLVDPSRRRLTDPSDSSAWVPYGIEVSWEGTISADMLV